MKKLILALTLIPTSLQAQTYTQMQWGMDKTVNPYNFGANINGAWRNLGTFNPTTNTWGFSTLDLTGFIYQSGTGNGAIPGLFPGNNTTFKYTPAATYSAGTNYNLFYVPADSSAITGGAFANTLGTAHNFGGSSMTGGRQGIQAYMHQTAVTNSSNPNRNYVGVNVALDSVSGDGGTSSTVEANAKGAYFAFGGLAKLQAGATNVLSVSGGEINVAMATGSSSYIKSLWSLVWHTSDRVQGSGVDTMLQLGSQILAPGSRDGILFTDVNGAYPISSGGTLLRSEGSNATTLAYGIDLRDPTFTTCSFASTQFCVKPTGAVEGALFQASGTTFPNVTLYISTGAANEKYWSEGATSAGSLLFRTLNDANTAVVNWLEIDRSGLTPTNAIFTMSNSLQVGPNGSTNPSFYVDTSTASAVTGVKVKSLAVGNGVGVSAISSGINENLTIDAKGSGTITLNGTATGGVIVGANGSVTGQLGLSNGGVLGATTTIQNIGATSAYNFNLPTTVGTAGHLLTSQGGGTSSMTWTSPTTTVNGVSCTLGSTCTIAATTFALPITVSGTVNSGGIPYFNSATQMSSSSALAANALVIGGGAGVAPSTTTTGTGVVAAIGNNTNTAGGLVVPTAALGSGQIVLGGGSGSSPTTSANASIATGALTLGAAGTQGSVTMGGSTSGTLQIKPAAGAGTGSVLTLPGGTTDFSATGGTSQVVRQSTVGGALTVSQLAAGDLSNGTTGSNSVVLATSPTLVTPVLGAATGTSLALNGATLGTNALAVTGTTALSSTLTSAGHVITDATANALVAGANGSTNPAFKVDASTASSATGLNIKSAAAAAGVAVSAISSGTNENMTIDAKGTGTLTLNGTATGAVLLPNSATITGASGTSALTVTGGTQTGANSPALAITQTWNNAGTTFDGLTMTITETARTAPSYFARFYSGANAIWAFGTNGYLYANGNLIFGSSAVGAATPYNNIFDTNNNGAIVIGGGGGTPDPQTYYRQTTHRFQSIAAGANFARIDNTGISSIAGYRLGGAGASGTLAISATAPTISSGFGTTPSVTANNGTAAFRINVGTGGTATNGVVGLPTAANGWNCFASDITTPATGHTIKQTATSTTSVTLTNYNNAGTATAWTASDIIIVNCMAY